MARILSILIAFVFSQQARAQEPTSLAPAAEAGGASRWLPPQPETAKQINEKAAQPAKVRIGLRLTAFKKVVTRSRDGKADTRYVPLEPLRHTLRARLNQTNHFFVGEWHIESVPTRWVKKTRHYEVRLNLYRRYGAFGQLEETVGSVNLAGILDEQEDNVHVLIGVARQRLRDKFGHPEVDVVAGFAPGGKSAALSLGDGKGNAAPATPPPGYTGNLLRGRF